MAVLLENFFDEIVFVDVLVPGSHLSVVDRNDCVVVDFDDGVEVVVLASVPVDHIGHEASWDLEVVRQNRVSQESHVP